MRVYIVKPEKTGGMEFDAADDAKQFGIKLERDY
jgi:hypothetical protein